VLAIADTPETASKAIELGAEGIGMYRTERMFNAPERLPIVRDMIMSGDTETRAGHLYKLFPYLLSDFKEVFSAIGRRPVIVRLLDSPLQEFLPLPVDLVQEIQAMRERGASEEEVRHMDAMLNRVKQLDEHNPLMGHRGCRLAVTYPEIYEMQTKAILSAAIELDKEGKTRSEVKILIPFIAVAGESEFLRKVVDSAAEDLFGEMGRKIGYQVGTSIDTPRSALATAEIAKHSDFLSFGTDDLTQMTFGFSRDDIETKVVRKYVEMGILSQSPFDSIDAEGVGRLIKTAIEEGRRVKPELEMGVNGEQTDPKSVRFFNEVGLNYVSCAAFRVPVVRLAAAQSMLSKKTAAVTT